MKYKYMIFLDEVVKIPKKAKVTYVDGLPVYIKDYGMGSVEWSLLVKKTHAKKRKLLDNVLWAVRRLNYARKYNPKELPILIKIILSGGKSRQPGYWKKLPGKE